MIKYFSPTLIRTSDFIAIQLGIQKEAPVVYTRRILEPNIIVPLIPVRILGREDSKFYCQFIGNTYYRTEFDALEGSKFSYVYRENGTYDIEASCMERRKLIAQCADHQIPNILIPDFVKKGDILLCNENIPYF